MDMKVVANGLYACGIIFCMAGIWCFIREFMKEREISKAAMVYFVMSVVSFTTGGCLLG